MVNNYLKIFYKFLYKCRKMFHKYYKTKQRKASKRSTGKVPKSF